MTCKTRASLSTGPGHELLPEGLDGDLELFGRAVIGQDLVGLSAFLFERTLDLLTSGEPFERPASTGFEPGQASLGTGVDEDDDVAKRVPTRFVKNGGVKDYGGNPTSPRLAGDGFLEGLPHGRMEDRFQVSKRLGPGEYDRSERPTVDRPTDSELSERFKHILAKPFEDAVPARALFKEDVTDGVGVEQEGSEAGERGGREALAGPDPADNADHGDRTIPPGTGGSATRAGIFSGKTGHDDSIHARNSGGTQAVGRPGLARKPRTTQAGSQFGKRSKGFQLRGENRDGRGASRGKTSNLSGW
jgi:hypothetical protein